MYEEQLTKVGLSKDQALVYESLIQSGPVQASYITRKVPLSRPLVYKILGELEALELVEKQDEVGQISIFSPMHPSKLIELVEKKKKELKETTQALDSAVSGLTSEFNLISGKPGIRFYTGIEGLKNIYQDILLTGKDICLIRPVFEKTFNEKMVPVVEQFIKNRLRKNIKVTAITPSDIAPKKTGEDLTLLLDRTWVPIDLYDSPVEMNIYGNKIAILSYAQELVGVIIESPQIAGAMRQVFMLARIGATVPQNEIQ